MNTSIPVAGFYFKLSLGDSASLNDKEAAFQEVSGISMNLRVQEVTEGGENSVRGRKEYSDLVLKRGHLYKDSKLCNWIENTMTNEFNSPIQPQSITVQLFDGERNALSTWIFTNAYPVKWEISQMNEQANEIIIESLTFQYSYFAKK